MYFLKNVEKYLNTFPLKRNNDNTIQSNSIENGLFDFSFLKHENNLNTNLIIIIIIIIYS